MRQDFSKDKSLAACQRLAVAHLEAGAAIEQRYVRDAGAERLCDIEAVQDLHHELIARQTTPDRFTPDGQPIVPGELRPQAGCGHRCG